MDVEHGLRFTHMMAEETRRSVYETAVTVLALVEELKENGTIDAERFELRRQACEKIAAAEAEARAKIRLVADVDKYSVSGSDVLARSSFQSVAVAVARSTFRCR